MSFGGILIVFKKCSLILYLLKHCFKCKQSIPLQYQSWCGPHPSHADRVPAEETLFISVSTFFFFFRVITWVIFIWSLLVICQYLCHIYNDRHYGLTEDRDNCLQQREQNTLIIGVSDKQLNNVKILEGREWQYLPIKQNMALIYTQKINSIIDWLLCVTIWQMHVTI